ncbi:hypothetical protein FE633_13010 [Streptomyces montanus]|uniref:Uncharacterized protein n=1 Tax=Streptomyces montanus TaxID=2580423 RepID=A0A5R9FUJ1_9ACTN|nr:hypothetical protein [Streptomyces montanus]TLS45686.1 hypothetical protein FE633_13010 [Streptomyces montanus]
MTHDVANSVLASVIALRVFAPDVVALVRRMLGAGVRVGAAALMERRTGTPPAPAAPAGFVQGEDGGRQ